MRALGTLFVVLAVVLVQVPWIPCHCEGACTPRPVLGAEVHTCDEGPATHVAHTGCGCAHHHHHGVHPPASAPDAPSEPDRPEDSGPDHDHDLVFLQAVSPASAASTAVPTQTIVAVQASYAPTLRPAERSGWASVRAPPDAGPPARLASVRLLL